VKEIVVVIVVIPIVIGAPAVRIFIPPPTGVVPAMSTRFGEFMAPVLRFRALPSMLLDGFVKSVVRLGRAFLAFLLGTHDDGLSEQKACCYGQDRNTAGKFHLRPPNLFCSALPLQA